jgi:Methylase involved in ubiquinone/menaquinone biosynthesis
MTELLDIFRALADPTRLRIVALLREMELAIGELALVLEQSQPRVSRHVRILVDAGIIERRREGSWVFLRIVAQGPVSNMIARAEEWPFSPREALVVAHDARRLAAVRADRVAAAERYFAEHAAEWDAIRSRHVAESEVEAAMLAMVAGRRLGHLLDIGTGTGRMAEIFAPTVRRITALDRSPDMLRIARAKLADQPVPIDLVQGDFLNLPMADASIDSIVIHQALHFAHEPDRVIAELAGYCAAADTSSSSILPRTRMRSCARLRHMPASAFRTRRSGDGSPPPVCSSRPPRRLKAGSWP